VETQSLSGLEYNLGLIDKQIRMLRALADVSPLVHCTDAGKSIGPPESEVEFVAVSRNRLLELVERLELEVGVVRLGIERLKN